MKLSETVAHMKSNDHRDRFKAEYWQLKIRRDKLSKLLAKIVASEVADIEVKYSCPIEILEDQLTAMENYLKILEIRAAIEKINLEVDD